MASVSVKTRAELNAMGYGAVKRYAAEVGIEVKLGMNKVAIIRAITCKYPAAEDVEAKKKAAVKKPPVPAPGIETTVTRPAPKRTAKVAPVAMSAGMGGIGAALKSHVPVPVLKSIFRKYDTDGNGVLDNEEWENMFKDIYVRTGGASVLLKKLADGDGDGGVDLDEFLHFVREYTDVALDPRKEETLDLIVNAWNEMDAAGTGEVNWEQFYFYFSDKGLSDDEVGKRWSEADINGDGVLSLDEFWMSCVAE